MAVVFAYICKYKISVYYVGWQWQDNHKLCEVICKMVMRKSENLYDYDDEQFKEPHLIAS